MCSPTKGGPQPPVSRGCAGSYVILEQGDEVCLKYLLDLPDEPGPVQDDFPISKWGHNAIAVKVTTAAWHHCLYMLW